MNCFTSFFVMKSNISVDIKKLMQRSAYERVLYELVEASTKVFPGHYKHISKQPNGECDFIKLDDQTKFEAKLVMTTQLGKAAFSRKGNVNNYIIEMYKEAAEFSHCFNNHGKKIENCALYGVIEKNIQKTKEDENVILFIPYPIVPDAEDFPLKGTKDFLTYIYKVLLTNKVAGKRKIYFIYLGGDRKVVLRNMQTDDREYLSCSQLEKFLKYEIVDLQEINASQED